MNGIKSNEELRIVMQPRSDDIGQWVADCAADRLTFSELCRRVSALGFKTTSMFEAVRAARLNLQRGNKMTNLLQIFVYLLAAHAVCDYPLQGDWLSKAKNPTLIFDPTVGLRKPVESDRYSTLMLERIWPLSLASHALIHAVAVQLITGSWALGVAEFIVHFLIDYSKCKGLFGYNTDQALHVGCKAVWIIALLLLGVPK